VSRGENEAAFAGDVIRASRPSHSGGKASYLATASVNRKYLIAGFRRAHPLKYQPVPVDVEVGFGVFPTERELADVLKPVFRSPGIDSSTNPKSEKSQSDDGEAPARPDGSPSRRGFRASLVKFGALFHDLAVQK
jgi:hypothetical protein